MPAPTHGISTAKGERQHDATNSSWWLPVPCSNCGPVQALIVAATFDGAGGPTTHTMWLRCGVCRRATAVNSGVLAPSPSTLSSVGGTPDDVGRVWEEVRSCMGVGALTAAVMLCRKILIHVAVGQGLPEKDDNDRAPSFAAAVAHLESVGLVTPPMKPWVKHIKDVGNEANHELAALDAEKAGHVATFTYQLLVLTYEMPAKMAEAVGRVAAEPPPVEDSP